jgi:formylglycine-generating enzyme required for sulfatase activity
MARFIHLFITASFLTLVLSCATAPKNTGVVDSDGTVLIPRGWFYMGYDDGEFNEAPEHEVYLKAFRIDGYEVSATEFAEFLNEKGNADERYFSCEERSTIICFTKDGEQTINSSGKNIVRFAPRPGYARYPANNVSWYGAENFCRWKGRRLPTEAEWEKAARGDDRRVYPWGDRRPDDVTSRYDKEWEKNGLDVLFPVDALPGGRSNYGVYNMAGNALEWVRDWYRQNYCDFCDPSGADYAAVASEILGPHDTTAIDNSEHPGVPPKYNSEGPAVGSFKVLRGGSWYDKSGSNLRSSQRFWLDPLERYAYTGFRCAAGEIYTGQPSFQRRDAGR